MIKATLPTVVTCLYLAACSPMKMSVSEELRAGNEYAVKGRQGILVNQKLSFGEYTTSKVKRSWTPGTQARTGIGTGGTAQEEWVNMISMEYVRKKQTLHFSLAAGDHSSEVYCVSNFRAESLVVGKNPNSVLNIGLELLGAGSSDSKYYVQIFTKEGERPWELVLDNQAAQGDRKRYKGFLGRSRSDYYTIRPVFHLEQKGRQGAMPFGSAGYEIVNPDGTAVAAVSLIDKGMVFLGKTNPEERFLMANLCAALLLQEQIG
ncbi:hypothetical protein V9K67_18930 [Paraflavisolibacter sp. H34]|uniref:hypothetical protein n=1 Tax=Huijunlia imazamoxiresistens TaxID=3127457 RepID=UPI003019EB8C